MKIYKVFEAPKPESFNDIEDIDYYFGESFYTSFALALQYLEHTYNVNPIDYDLLSRSGKGIDTGNINDLTGLSFVIDVNTLIGIEEITVWDYIECLEKDEN